MMLDRVFAYCEQCQLLSSRILVNLNQDLESFFWRQPFVYSKEWSLFLFERCSTSLMCAVKHRVQVGMYAFTVVHNASQHLGRSPYTFLSFFFLFL